MLFTYSIISIGGCNAKVKSGWLVQADLVFYVIFWNGDVVPDHTDDRCIIIFILKRLLFNNVKY